MMKLYIKRSIFYHKKLKLHLDASLRVMKRYFTMKCPEAPSSCCSGGSGDTMEAIVFDGKNLSLKHMKDFPMPKIINDDDVIVKIHYAGVCGTDVHIIQGEFPASKEHPMPLGHESSGEIHAVGKNCIFKVGQKVAIDPDCACNLCEYCRKGTYQHCQKAGLYGYVGIFKNGGWAQYLAVPQTQIYVLPEGITTEMAGLTEPISCLAHSYDRASPLCVGQRILIVGAGIIGNLWVSILHHLGHRDVTVVDSNKTRLDIVDKIDTGFCIMTPDCIEKENMLYDVIIDNSGSAKAMDVYFTYMKPGGKYVLFGCCPPTQQTSLNPFQIFDKELTIIGAKINPFSFPSAIGWIKAMGPRYVNYEKLGVKVYRLSDYKTALEDLKAGVVAKAMFKVAD